MINGLGFDYDVADRLSIPFIGFLEAMARGLEVFANASFNSIYWIQKNKWNIVNGIIAECTFNSIYWILEDPELRELAKRVNSFQFHLLDSWTRIYSATQNVYVAAFNSIYWIPISSGTF